MLLQACWAISYISDGPNDRIEAVIQANIVPRLIELLMAAQTSVQTPALRTIGNIVTGNDKQTQVIINGGTLPCLGMLLSHPRKGIRKETCWTISNIAAGSTDQVQVRRNGDDWGQHCSACLRTHAHPRQARTHTGAHVLTHAHTCTRTHPRNTQQAVSPLLARTRSTMTL